MEKAISDLEEFNAAFNRLDEAISKKLNQSRSEKLKGFKYAINKGRSHGDKVISTYYQRLDEINRFRNLIIHDSKVDDEPIAYPSSSIIEEIDEMTRTIINPYKVKDLFLEEVISFKKEDSLKKALETMKTRSYSQFPIFNGHRLIGLVTENSIANFLAKSIEDDIISIKDTSLAEILELHDGNDVYDIIYQNKSIYDIEEIFIKQMERGNTTFSLLITRSANGEIDSPEDIVGIITPWDIPEILEYK